MALLVGCDGASSFGGGTSGKGHDADLVPAVEEPQTTDQDPSDVDQKPKKKKPKKEEPEVDDRDEDAEDAPDLSHCWVAVSGILFGFPRYNGNTLDPTSPYPFKGAARPEVLNPQNGDAVLDVNKTYEYHTGDAVFDKTVDTSLDNIVIPPNVRVEVYKAGTDAPVATFDGPRYIVSGYASLLMNETLAWIKGRPDAMPPWLAGVATEHVQPVSAGTKVVITLTGDRCS